MVECACTTEETDYIRHPELITIEFCPLHAAAPALYEALKRAQPYLRTALKHGVYDHEINQIVFDILADIDGSGE